VSGDGTGTSGGTSGMKLYTLKKRATETALPLVTVVDMKDEFLSGNRSILSGLLKEEISSCLDLKQQAILFLNRRGYASFVSCRECGYAIICDNCNVTYTFHKPGYLICHYCGLRVDMPATCPVCNSKYIKQFGVGTQKLEQLISEEFPEAKILRMDLDSVKNNSHKDILSSFAQGGADILIGTQMIAKGHDFAGVTLVCIVAADLSLNAGDFRAAETTFQLMTQVAGRAGRKDGGTGRKGRVVAQTYNPGHYAVLNAKTQDYTGFYQDEIRIRGKMGYPPFMFIFTVQLTCEDEKKLVALIFRLSYIMEHFKKRGDYETIGPAPCTISKIKKRFRWRIIVKSSDETKLKNFCLHCVGLLKKENDLTGVNVNLTLNPNRVD
jgi:primosomal protein N' (replication factor Y)